MRGDPHRDVGSSCQLSAQGFLPGGGPGVALVDSPGRRRPLVELLEQDIAGPQEQSAALAVALPGVVETDEPTIGVDTEDDVKAVEAWLASRAR